MKKTYQKWMGGLIAICLFLGGSFNFVQAANVEIDPQNYITMPSMIYGETAHITVSSNAGTSYQLAAQNVMLTDEQYTVIQNKAIQSEKVLEELKAKAEEYEELAKAAQTKYQEELQKDPTSEAAKTAKSEYDAAVKTYEDFYEEAKRKEKAEREELIASFPQFVDSKWKSANDGTAEIDFEGKTGNIHFILWVKLTTSSGTYYDCSIYSTTVETEKPESSITLNYYEFEIAIGVSFKLEATSDSDKKIIWESEDESIATVDQTGMVTAKKIGKTKIIARFEDNSDRVVCDVGVFDQTSNPGDENNNEQKPQGNITIPDSNQNSGGNTSGNSNKPTNVTGNMDNTKADGKIPQAGVNPVVWIPLGIVIVAGVIGYQKYKKYNF